MRLVCCQLESVELEIRFDARVVGGEKPHQRIVPRDLDAIGVDQNPLNVPLE